MECLPRRLVDVREAQETKKGKETLLEFLEVSFHIFLSHRSRNSLKSEEADLDCEFGKGSSSPSMTGMTTPTATSSRLSERCDS